jgi:type II secretory pathway pseudopilin PulG
MGFHSQIRPRVRRGEDGYALLLLLLTMALMIIFAGALASSIAFDIKRDREEEMIHRGVQYSRAIRAYYKKLGRYPTKLEDLESTNNMRFLRKRYKDPITGKDFKLLHFGDPGVTMTLGGLAGGVGGGGINGATSLNAPAQGPPLQQSGGINPGATFLNPANGVGGTQPPPAAGPNANTPATGNSNTTATPGDTTQNSDSTAGSPTPGQQQPEAGSAAPTSPTFGGGAIVGVASTSKKETIREFNHKNKYSDWQFIYDPATDRGGLLMTPNQPQIQGFGQQVAPANGQTNTGIGGSTQPFGGQNNPTQPVTGTGTPNNPENPSQQQ